MAEDEQRRLDEHLENIRVTALRDLRALAGADGGMGVFLLAIPIIDALANASSSSREYWQEYVAQSMPRL